MLVDDHVLVTYCGHSITDYYIIILDERSFHVTCRIADLNILKLY